MTEEQIAAIFEEWMRQYNERPEDFSPDDHHEPKSYGELAAATFLRIKSELFS
jgi:hypothetical protein